MHRYHLAFRITGVMILACFAHVAVLPAVSWAQECSYDRANPSLDNARISFKSLDYKCAEEEINDFLKLESIPIEQRADAHVLLAAVYYAKSKNDSEKRNLVVDQFKAAFRAYRAWRGELDITSTEFIEMMNAAKALVDEEAAKKPAPVVPPVEEKPAVAKPEVTKPEVTKPQAAEPAKTEGKAWYKKWWAIGLGVGVVALAAVALGGGGDDGGGGGGGTTDSLPGPPRPPPAGK